MKDRLKELRKVLNLKQRDIAERLGVDVSTVGGWESGRPASRSGIRQLCKEYNINRHWLETGEGEMFEPDEKKLSAEEIQTLFVQSILDQMTDDQRRVVYEAMERELQHIKEEAEKK